MLDQRYPDLALHQTWDATLTQSGSAVQQWKLPVEAARPGARLKGYSVLQAPPTMSFSSKTCTCRLSVCAEWQSWSHRSLINPADLEALPGQQCCCHQTIVPGSHNSDISLPSLLSCCAEIGR